MLTVIASFPKSGNTWIRSLLTCYIKNRRVNLDDMASIVPIDTSRGLWSEYVGIKDVTDENVFQNRARFYRALKEKIEGKNLYLKAHSANLNVKEYPLFAHDVIDKIIHIVRNPFDVLPSFTNHMGISIEDAWIKMKNDSTALQGNDKQYRELVSSWHLHTKSWIARRNETDRYIFVRYEDLKLKPITAMTKIIDFLGIGTDEERVANSIYWSSFKNRSQEEEEEGFKERPRADSKFFRKGQIGSFHQDMPEHIKNEMMEKYEEFCNKLGYKVR